MVQIERQIILNEPSLIFEFAHQRFVMFFMVFRTKYNIIMSTCATVSSKEFKFLFLICSCSRPKKTMSNSASSIRIASKKKRKVRSRRRSESNLERLQSSNQSDIIGRVHASQLHHRNTKIQKNMSFILFTKYAL